MNILDVLAIISVFLIVAYIGWAATKKTKTSDDFLMANRSLGKIQAGFSMAATDIGGNAVVGATAYAYARGLGGAWYNWGAVIPMFLLAFVLAKQLRRMPVLSVPDLLGKRYSDECRLISVIAQLLAIGASLGIQFVIAASTISTISGMNYNLALIITVVIVVGYTIGGGLLAVVNTDVFQFVIICVSVILVIPFGLSRIGGFDILMQKIPSGYMNIGSQGFLVPMSLGLLYMFDYATNQHILQRVFSAKDSSTARFAFTFSSIMYIVFGLVIAFIGVLAYALYPNLEDPQIAYSMIIKEVLPNGVAGIALGGLFAAAMSTADSKIIAASQLFINDIYKPYFCKDKEIGDNRMLNISRIITLIICVLGIGFCLISDSIIQMMYVGGLFYGTAVFIPMIMGIYWKRGTTLATIISMLATMCVGLYSEYFMAGKLEGFLGMPSNLLAIIVSLVLFVVISLATEPPTEEQLAILEEGKSSTI
ncbi:sodium:solute symporter family protein [Schnuerera ultunensis]|uniref:Putative Solute:sodium symporter (SSS) family transporter n=1 Tax=[Clostridium] ultunense Esp TaxID=1288971 RepID=A0A1M4PLP0_9FIRM|nr:sodium:solute symporter family protein [Schnuerera ultunensis]SHD76370.1 putative Solute:sodium symporter (SSS) family transporter [[Clostridium] ultunense Esp]